MPAHLASFKTASLSDKIVQILKDAHPRSVRELHQQIEQDLVQAPTYQAVHKAVLQLEKRGVLEKTGTTYRISKTYADSIVQLGSELQAAFSQPQSISPKMQEKTFETVIEFGRFLIHEFLHYPNPRQLPVVCHWALMYSLIGLSKHDLDEFAKQAATKNNYVLCQSNTLLDQSLASSFQKLGVHVKLGVPVAYTRDLFINADYIMEVYYNPAHHARWKQIWQTTKQVSEYDLNTIFDSMFGKYPLRVRIYENNEIAKQIREKTMKEFGD